MEKVSIKDEKFEDLVSACMRHILKEALSTKVPSGIRSEFRENLIKAVDTNCKNIPKETPNPYVFAVIEDLLRLVSRSIVGLSYINPTILQTYGDLSDAQGDLLKRELEECLLGITVDVLKSLILDDHINIIAFHKE
ncbi:hypothetical protein LCGC14_1393410 [marine sediment metagenome]|uniref:Uncharacterized protein n=1 Tax=marine sediment metagenome TaxID=412755 RepID=A0A0F9MER2_9ZZZZ